MKRAFRIGRETFDLPAVALTYLAGTAGGLVAKALHLPLPMLIGSLVTVAALAILGLRPFGQAVQAPQALRMVFVPIIGVAIGAAFRPGLQAEAAVWWPTLLAVVVFVPIVHVLGYRAVRAVGRVDPVTAWFGTAPGGLIEAVELGEQAGAEVRMLTMLQFLRLIVVIVMVPLAFSIMAGRALGSAAGASLGAAGSLGAGDVAILVAAAVVGAVAGRRLRLPAGHVTGPILLSGAAHMAGWTETVPPFWLIAMAQVVIGTSLGVRFAGMPRGQFRQALGLASLNVAITLTVAAGIAVALHGAVGEPMAAVFLAFSPGGLVEMGLVALSLNMSPVYVTAHHVLRIVLAVTVARIGAGRV